MMDCKIISTGSKGNAVVLGGRILIDCGVPFRALKGVYKELKLVLLTHIHNDHFNRRTIKKLAQERPTLRFGCPEWLAGDLLDLVEPKNIDILQMNGDYMYPRIETIVEPFPLVHNVPNCGWHISSSQYGRAIYATDTNSLDGVVAKNYDLYLIEANYTEPEMQERIRSKLAAGKHCYEYDVINNHLSKEKADRWLYENMGVNSRYVYMHEHIERGAQCADG